MEDLEEPEVLVPCKVCGERFEGSVGSHVWRLHDMLKDDYIEYCKRNNLEPNYLVASYNRGKAAGVSKEDIIEEIKRIHEKHGKVTYDLIDQEVKYSAGIVNLRFGSIPQAVLEAGLEPENYTKISKEQVDEAIQKTYEEHGKVTIKTFEKTNGFCRSHVFKFYDNWNHSLKENEIPTNYIGEIDKEEVIDNLKMAAKRVDGLLTYDQYKDMPDTFHSSTVERKFGTWEKAKKELGLETRDYYREKIVEDAQEWLENYDLSNGRPKINDFLDKQEYTFKVLERKYDDNYTSNLWTDAGFETPEGKTIPYSFLIQDLRRVYSEVEGKVTGKDYKEKGYFSVSVMNTYFGSWKEAKKEAGVIPGELECGKCGKKVENDPDSNPRCPDCGILV